MESNPFSITLQEMELLLETAEQAESGFSDMF